MDIMKVAEALSALRVIPRLMLGTYTLAWYETISWFMTLTDPTMEQAGLVSVVTGAGAAWFGLYLGGSKK